MNSSKLKLNEVARLRFPEIFSEFEEAIQTCLAGPTSEARVAIEKKVQADADYVRSTSLSMPEIKPLAAEFLHPAIQVDIVSQKVASERKDACGKARALEEILNLEMWDLINKGEFIVEGRLEPVDPRQSPMNIALDILNDLKPHIVENRLVGRDISFASIRLFETPENAAQHTINAEKKCQSWLTDLMESGPKEDSKDHYREMAKSKFKTGTKAFDRAWREAIKATDAKGWNRPGPRQKTNS